MLVGGLVLGIRAHVSCTSNYDSQCSWGVSRTDRLLAEDMDTEMVMMVMNSAPMQMMQHDRMSLLNNPSREINQHGRGQTAISCSTTHHKKVCGYGRPECEKEEGYLLDSSWRKLYPQIILFAINGCVTWHHQPNAAKDIIIYVLNYI